MYALKKLPSSTTDSDSQNTSVDPPKTHLPYAEPSTSWAHDNARLSTSAAAADKPSDPAIMEPVSSSSDDDYLSSDESDSDENFSDIIQAYMLKRNIRVSRCRLPAFPPFAAAPT